MVLNGNSSSIAGVAETLQIGRIFAQGAAQAAALASSFVASTLAWIFNLIFEPVFPLRINASITAVPPTTNQLNVQIPMDSIITGLSWTILCSISALPASAAYAWLSTSDDPAVMFKGDHVIAPGLIGKCVLGPTAFDFVNTSEIATNYFEPTSARVDAGQLVYLFFKGPINNAGWVELGILLQPI